MLLSLAIVIRLYEENRRSDIVLAGIFGGLAVMSHPEAAVHTAISAVFLWLVLSRKRVAFIRSIFVGIIVLIVTAPWWGTVISNHGAGPLLNAAATGQKNTAIFHLVFFVFTEETYATMIAIFGLIGIAHRLLRRDYLLPLWMAIPFFVEGRSAAGPASIPLAMLAAIGLVNVIFAALKGGNVGEPNQFLAESEAGIPSVERNVFIYLLLYLIFSTSQFNSQLATATLYPPDSQAMKWIRENTPNDSRFLVLTGTTSVSCDSVLEWFPALARRKSIFTVQGTEWTKGKAFNEFVISTYAVQACLNASDVACVDSAIGRSQYDYVYISKILRTDNCKPTEPHREFPFLVASLVSGDGFDVVYETKEVVVVERK
jgi:hypothetical protein